MRTDLFSIEREISAQEQVVYSQIIEVSHYKWATDRIIDRVRADYRITSEMVLPPADEHKRILDHYDQNGRFAWEEFGGQLLMPGAARVELDGLTEQLDRASTAPEDGWYGR